MQGQRGAIDSLPESLAFEHGSASNETGVVEPQIFWNTNARNPPPNRTPDYISLDNTSDDFRNTTNQESQNVGMWSMGESGSSSMSNQVGQSRIEPKTEHGWPSLMKEPPASMLSLGDVNTNITHNHANSGQHGPFFVQSSVAHNVTVNPLNFIGTKPTNYSTGSNAGSSSSNPFELEARGLQCKRKAAEISVGESSSGIGSSNLFQRAEGGTPSDRIIPRLGLGVGGVSNRNPVVENTHRNVRLRINNNNNNNVQSNGSSLRLNPVDLRSPPLATPASNSSNHEGQPALRLPALRRNLQASSRWTRGSSSRTNRSSNIAISRDNSRTIPSNISDHPIFLQPNAVNWSLNGGVGSGTNNGTGIAASSTPVAAPSSAAPTLAPHRGSPHYPSRRLSEILRRSLLSSTDSGVGGQNSNLFSRIPPPVGTSSSSSSQDAGMPPIVGGIQGHHNHHRQLDGAFGFPYLSRSMVAGSEGRGRLVSEIRNVLDLIRRGEGLRFEDFMLLDRTVFYGMADIHDRHRDMRLDIDNMSYEELLALEERIGNVNTGLTEETISSRLKLKTYVTEMGQLDAEPCCICQEEYSNGDDLGALECCHDFHTSCIKKWLLQKNMCPVCKSTAFSTTK